MREHWNEVAVLAGLLALLLASMEFGYRAGRRAVREHEAPGSPQVSAIQGALLGLLGLLLAFSFAAAGGRFLERQDQIVLEANAIGGATLRADLLDEPYASNLRDALQRYTEHRRVVTADLVSGLSPEQHAEIERLQGQI
jgi:type IV secretory pathway TrbF-like protein